MQFNWKEFMDETNKIAVHCKTEEEAIDFCKQMDEHGLRWQSGTKYIERNSWYEYKDQMCYYNTGEFSDFKYAKEISYRILEWSDYMAKNPIDYLKYGYLVEFENGKIAMYLQNKNRNIFVYEEDYIDIDYYNKELKISSPFSNKKYDIFAIYGYAEKVCDCLKLDKKTDLLFGREKNQRK